MPHFCTHDGCQNVLQDGDTCSNHDEKTDSDHFLFPSGTGIGLNADGTLKSLPGSEFMKHSPSA